ncbi:MAG: hypothetical protein BWZ07_02767 [Alphaproteobacteria bacterium ADurb.BinA280]|nr:MAG: hypothetical protein BWZ07_02767 [Alphaproteobacteria bacterium ADurb.BinA280]
MRRWQFDIQRRHRAAAVVRVDQRPANNFAVTDIAARSKQIDITIGIKIGPTGGVDIQPGNGRSGHCRLRIATTQLRRMGPNDRAVIAIRIAHIACNKDVGHAIRIDITPIRQTVLNLNRQQLTADEAIEVITIAPHVSGFVVWIHVGNHQIQITIIVVVDPTRLDAHTNIEAGSNLGEQPSTQPIRAIVAHQYRVKGRKRITFRGWKKDIQITVIIGICPSDRTQVVGTRIGRVFHIARKRQPTIDQQTGVVPIQLR